MTAENEAINLYETDKATVITCIGTVIWSLLKFSLITFGFYIAINLMVWLPDIDQFLIGFLHHRSIITHSILLPVLLLVITKGSLRWVSAILFAAIGIHLSADLLSPSTGYGAIWLPEPMKLSLGEWSKVWISLNIIGAFYFSYNSLPAPLQSSLFWATSFAGASYGIQNENSIISTGVILLFSLPTGLWQSRRLKFPVYPAVGLEPLRAAIKNAKLERKKHKEYKMQLSAWERTKINFKTALDALIFIPRVSIHYPKTSLAIVACVCIVVATSLFTGRNVAVEIAKSGQWVVHSSGAYILQEGGKYVAGTLTREKP